MLIRHATRADLLCIRALEQQADTAAHWPERGYDALFSPDAPKRITLVAVDESDEVHGFIIARCGFDEWEIENVVVAVDRRRGGVGSRLVRELLRQGQRAGVTSVLLEVRDSNAAARRVYEKLGFTLAGRRNRYYQQPEEDALLLKFLVSGL
jgi:ribosomal-protein-alanine N-acetyltransferase